MATRSGFLGTFGVAAAIVTALLRPGLPPASPPSNPRSGGESVRQGASGSMPGAPAADKLNTFESGTSLLCAYFGESIPPGTVGDSSSESCKGEIAKATIRPLIVTLPDPISSHLDWSYDAGLESVFRAFERSGFVIDRFWLPWHARSDTATAATLARSLPGTAHPGVLLFRKIADGQLQLVYVIGEVPTFGIHQAALRSALDEIHRLGLVNSGESSGHPLRIVGPVFSGSSTSLRAVLLDALHLGPDSAPASGEPAPPPRKPRVTIISGAASNFGNLAILNDPRVQLEFSATVHSSQALQAAEAFALNKLKIERSEIAFLHEGSTVYGMASATSAKAASELTLTFPMNISSLRTQYARHPLTSASGASGNPAGAPAGPRLPLDLREPATLTERPAVISELTAPAAELELAEIERTLLLHRIRAVGILATDVRDALFLADELRRSLPDVQLFFYGSNVMFLREEYRKALRGSLVLSTYPLFLENQSWYHGSGDNTAAMFMSDETEGIYNATLLQLGNPGALTDYGRIRDSAGTIDQSRPPIWITTVGRSSFFPVAFIPTDSTLNAAGEREYLHGRVSGDGGVPEPGPAHLGDFLLSLALVPAGLVGSFWVLQQKSARRVHPAWALRRDRKLLGGDTKEEIDWLSRQRVAISLLLHRELYVLLRYFALFGAFASLLLVVLRPMAHGQAVPAVFLVTIGVIGLILTALVAERAIVQSARVVAVSRRQSINLMSVDAPGRALTLWWIEVVARSLVLVTGLLYFIATIAFVWQVLHLRAGRSPLFFQRVVAITSGVSPALPLILAGVGFAAWASWHLLRINLLAEPTTYETFLLRKAEAERKVQRSEELRREAGEYAVWAVLLLRWGLFRRRAQRRQAGQAEQGRAALNGDIAAANGDQVMLSVASNESSDSLLERGEAAAEVSRRLTDSADLVVAGVATSGATTSDAEAAHHVADKAQQALHLANEQTGMISDETAITQTAELKVRAQYGTSRTQFGKITAKGYSRIVDWLERNLRKDPRASAAAAAQEVRDTLFYLVPTFPALVSLLIVGVATVWLLFQFEHSMETMALPPLHARLSVSWFDALFRFGILAAVGVTTWAVYRLLQVWRGLRRQLDRIDRALLPAFVALPPTLGRVTRLTPFGHPSRADIQELVAAKWAALRSIYEGNIGALAETRAKLSDDAYRSRLWPPIARVRAFRIGGWADRRFGELVDSVKALRVETEAAPHEPEDAKRRWVDAASVLLAVYIADYLDWVFQHLRYLAAFLLVSLVVTMTLLASYPFQPQSAVKVVYLIVMGVGVASLLTITVQMSRDVVLQAITNTADAPGGKPRDPHLIGNLLTYGLIPLLTLLSAEVPGVRTLLFSWVMPLLRAFAKN